MNIIKKRSMKVKVIIVGGGKVGELLCADFSNTFDEVTIIDTNERRVEKLVETYDINGLIGNGAIQMF